MTPMTKKYPLWSLFYEDDGYNINGKKLMGRQAAGWSFLKALVSNSDHLSVYLKDPDQKQLLIDRIKPLLSNDQKLNLNTINYTEPYKSAEYGGIFYPGPGINELASHRSYFGHDTYSIVGITHTTASHSVMNSLSSFMKQRSPVRYARTMSFPEPISADAASVFSESLQYPSVTCAPINKSSPFCPKPNTCSPFSPRRAAFVPGMGTPIGTIPLTAFTGESIGDQG